MVSDPTWMTFTDSNVLVLFFSFVKHLCWAYEKWRTRAPSRIVVITLLTCLNDQPPKAKPGSSKKPAAAPFGASKGTKVKKNPLFQASSKNFGIGNQTHNFVVLFLFILPFWLFFVFQGQDIRPKTDLTRFVKWPEYVRLQRQKVILHQRLKVPPAIAQFSHTLDKNTATQLFKLLNKYRPESTQEKKARLQAAAADVVAEKDAKVWGCLIFIILIAYFSFIWDLGHEETSVRQIWSQSYCCSYRGQEGCSRRHRSWCWPHRARRLPTRPLSQDGYSLCHCKRQSSSRHCRSQENVCCDRSSRSEERGPTWPCYHHQCSKSQLVCVSLSCVSYLLTLSIAPTSMKNSAVYGVEVFVETSRPRCSASEPKHLA